MQDTYLPSGVTVFIVAAVFTVLPTVAVALRIAGRRTKRIALWYDDYLIITSLVGYIQRTLKRALHIANFLAGCHVCFHDTHGYQLVSGVTNGDIGRPTATIPPKTLVFQIKALLAIQFLWVTGITLVKLGILFFYLRIFVLRRDRILTQVMMAVSACWWLAGVAAFSFSCRPFKYNWNLDQDGDCHSKLDFWIAVAIAHLGTDIIILLLPLPMVWTLQLPLRRKIGLSFLFALGIFVCIISAIRIRMIQSASRGDFAEALPYSHIWSFLEPTIAICTSCLPMARPVFGKYLPSLLHRSKSSETSEHQLVRNRA